jgi:hypothetical protein
MTQQIDRSVFVTTAFTAPKYGPGHEVYVDGYFGLINRDEVEHRRHCRLFVVQDIRLEARREERWTEPTVPVPEEAWGDMNHPYWEGPGNDSSPLPDAVTYPKGWEYRVVDAVTGDEWGWVTELEIEKAGY